MVPGTCSTTFHLLSYLSQHVPHPYRPVDSSHREHVWAALQTRCRWNLRNIMKLELLFASCVALRCVAGPQSMTPPAAKLSHALGFRATAKLGPAVIYH